MYQVHWVELLKCYGTNTINEESYFQIACWKSPSSMDSVWLCLAPECPESFWIPELEMDRFSGDHVGRIPDK